MFIVQTIELELEDFPESRYKSQSLEYYRFSSRSYGKTSQPCRVNSKFDDEDLILFCRCEVAYCVAVSSSDLVIRVVERRVSTLDDDDRVNSRLSEQR